MKVFQGNVLGLCETPIEILRLRGNAGKNQKNPVELESWGYSDKVGFQICWRY